MDNEKKWWIENQQTTQPDAPSKWWSEERKALGTEMDYFKGLGQGAAKQLGHFGASILNSPNDIYEYLGGKHLYHFNDPYQPSEPQSEIEESGQRMGPYIPDMLALYPPAKAASLIAKAPEGAALLSRLFQSGKKIATAGTAGALEGLAIGAPNREEKAKELGLESAGMEGLGQLISQGLSFRPSAEYNKAKNAYEQSLMNQQEQEMAYKKAQGIAHGETNIDKPERFAQQIENRNNNISEALDRMEELPHEEFPSEVTHQAHTQLGRIATENLNNLNENISRTMGEGASPDKPLAKNVVEFFEGKKEPGKKERTGGLRGEIGAEYNAVRDRLKDKKITVDAGLSSEELRRFAETEAKKHIKDRGITVKDIDRYERSFREDIKNSKKIDAQTYFDNYISLKQDINKQLGEIKENEYTKRYNLKEMQVKQHEVAEMQENLNNMEKNIETQSSPEIIQDLKKANHRWSTEYIPIRYDPIFKKMLKKRTIDKAAITEKLREEDPSGVILDRYFKNNSKAAELLANFQFSDNPMALQNLTRDQQQFISPQLTPNITRYIEQQQHALRNVERANQQQTHFEEVSKSVKEEQKRHNKLLDERQKLDKQIPKWKEEINTLSKHEEILTKELHNKNLTKEQVRIKKEELNEARKKKDRFSKKITAIAKFGALETYLRYRHKNG